MAHRPVPLAGPGGDPVSPYDVCRVCGREPVRWDLRLFEDVPLCEVHEALTRDAVRESMSRPTHETPFGVWLGIGSTDSDGREFVVCSRDRDHSSTHDVGTLCRWCVANYTEMVRYSREEVLARCEIDPDDVRYRDEIRRRQTQLLRAVKIRLVTTEEALQVLERLARPLRGESA
jgi:hypothetical protein